MADSAPKTRPNPTSKRDAARPEEPDLEDLETVLLQTMLDEFEVNVDDDSGLDLAQKVLKLREWCSKGQFEAVEELRTVWQSRQGSRVDGLFKKGEEQDQDTDWSGDDDGEDDDEDGEDVDMDEAPPLVAAVKERPPPEVDGEGFTKVTRKKR